MSSNFEMCGDDPDPPVYEYARWFIEPGQDEPGAKIIGERGNTLHVVVDEELMAKLILSDVTEAQVAAAHADPNFFDCSGDA